MWFCHIHMSAMKLSVTFVFTQVLKECVQGTLRKKDITIICQSYLVVYALFLFCSLADDSL